MLRLFYGRESLDKDRFLFDCVGHTLRRMKEASAGRTLKQMPEGSASRAAGQKKVGGADRTLKQTGRSGSDSILRQGADGEAALPKKILLIVPDQFTLQAEQNAFAYLDVPGLIDLEVLSQSRLGYRVLREAGGSTRLHIDQYGRHMVISRIINEIEEELTAYRGMKKSQSFVEMTNDFITEMKQNSVDADAMTGVMEAVEKDSLLYRKLSDIQKIYIRYEQELAGKYIDTEDYMALFTSKIPKSSMVRDSEIWIYGFDSFTIKSLAMIDSLMRCAVNVNVVMTGDGGRAESVSRTAGTEGEQEDEAEGNLFYLTERILFQLTRMAAEAGIPWEERAIPEGYAISNSVWKAPELLHLERQLYAWPFQSYKTEESGGGSAGRGDGAKIDGEEIRAEAGSKPEDRDGEVTALPGKQGAAFGEKEETEEREGKAGRGEKRYAALGFCRASNLYTEVETAAVRICVLTRDHGLRYGDIAVICNDLERYGSVIKRIFSQYEIPVFLDEKRGVLHNPAVELVLSLLDIITKGWQHQDVFRFLKTGLPRLEAEEYEELENYAIKYKIRGRRWKSEFRYGVGEYGEEGVAALNELRVRLTEPLAAFEKKFNGAETARTKSAALYEMLAETLGLPERLEALLAYLNDHEELLEAEEISQIWGVIVKLLDQLVELLGEERISGEDYVSMLQAGFAAVEIGLLPPTLDQIIVGTMQRTRRGRVRALLVIGANDGLLPADGGKEDLLSETEKAYLSEKNIVLCKNDDYRACEEQLAIYKNLSKPQEFLWVSYSVSDLDGREKKPSLIFDKLTKIFPETPVEKDVLNAEQALDLLQKERALLPHLSEALRERLSGEVEEVSAAWKIVYNYLLQGAEQMDETGPQSRAEAEPCPRWKTGPGAGGRGERSRQLNGLRRGLFFTNRVKRLDDKLVDRLYKNEGMADFILSPSRLERFGKCPFAHFVQYGLKPQERRIFEAAGREAGDVYHQCLMELSRLLTTPGVAATDQSSPWMNISEEECGERVDQLIDRISSEYREGVFTQGGEEHYRAERMKRIARSAAWAMVSHVRQGIIQEIYFEAGFGEGWDKPFPPIVVEAAGQRVRIEGKIDRVDVLAGSPEDPADGRYIKIVDYKSGNEHFDMEEARAGIRLQLMLYLEGAMGGVKRSRPAGVFYFEIAEPMINASEFSSEELSERVADQIRKSFKMDGIMVDDPQVIRGIAGEFSGFSEIVPIRRGTKGVAGTSEGRILEPETFEEFRGEIGRVVGSLCAELISGGTGIHPKKTKNQDACKYCQFAGICFFDLKFEDCKYR